MNRRETNVDPRRVRIVVTALALLVAVYAPAFAAVSLIRPILPVAMALVIGISLTIALAIIAAFARGGSSFAAFGFTRPATRFLGLGLACGIPLALGAAWATVAFPAAAPFDIGSLARWQLALFFLVAAPVQEEVVFRGLLQSFVQDRWPAVVSIVGVQTSFAVLGAAVLFALVHLGSGAATVGGAVALAVLAGELRRRSASLLPAIIVHSLFNAAVMLVTLSSSGTGH